MNDKDLTQLSGRLQLAARALPYPPTPDLAAMFVRGALPRRTPRLAWALAALLVALVSLLAVPEVRARVLEFLQIGAVRIIFPLPTETQSSSAVFPAERTATPTLYPYEVLSSVLDLDGETDLASARASTNFPIALPKYPPDLGAPDKVYLQETPQGKFVVLAWLDASESAELVMYIVGPGVSITKGPPDFVETAEVNGHNAIYVVGDYLVTINGSMLPVRFIHGPALIWEENGLTYRLEASLPLEEMIRVAESINGN